MDWFDLLHIANSVRALQQEAHRKSIHMLVDVDGRMCGLKTRVAVAPNVFISKALDVCEYHQLIAKRTVADYVAVPTGIIHVRA